MAASSSRVRDLIIPSPFRPDRAAMRLKVASVHSEAIIPCSQEEYRMVGRRDFNDTPEFARASWGAVRAFCSGKKSELCSDREGNRENSFATEEPSEVSDSW